ncbi:DUF6585 family protein [Nocardia bovistercoris]
MVDGSPAYEAPELLARVHRTAHDADLGGHRAVFARTRPRIEVWTLIFGLIAATALACAVALINEFITVTDRPGDMAGCAFGLLCVAPFVALPGYTFVTGLYRGTFGKPVLRAVRLDLYERGLVFADYGKLHCVRYDTTVIHRELVRHMLYGLLELKTTYRYDLVDVEGKRLSLTHEEAPQVTRWGPAIEHDLARAQLPSVTEKLYRDDHVSFGKLWLTTRGCGADRNSVLWSQVNQIAVINGRLWAHVDGRWLPLTSTSLAKIPNLCVFLALADQLIADSRGQGPAPA